jgi:hypothetical protein
MDQQINLNPMSRLCMKLYTNALLCVMFNKFMKVVELVVVQIMGIVEDEKTFNNLAFMKTSSTINCVKISTFVIHMYDQPFYTIYNFPYYI